MDLEPLRTRFKQRLDATRSWSAVQAARARHGAKAGYARVREGARAGLTRAAVWPWKRIALLFAGVFGVLAATFVLFVTFADWNAMKGPISRFASSAAGRPIEIRGDLDVDPWSLTPRIRVTQLYVGNPPIYNERGMFAEVQNAEVDVRLFPLFFGRLDIVRLDLDGANIALYRSAEGVSNWAPNARAGGKPFNLPAIRSFSVTNGEVILVDDKRGMELSAVFTSNESQEDTDQRRFVLNGDGSLNNRPFKVELTGAALINVRRDRPYAFNADVRMGGTRLLADGSIRRPFDLSAFTADITASGPDMADLYYLIGLTLPNTPPYQLAGNVARTGDRYTMTALNGRVGDSDLAGNFNVTRVNNRPRLVGEFSSRSLDFDDLLTVLGAAPDTSESASDEQRAAAARLAARGRLLPDARLDISRVRNMDAEVTYAAAEVRATNIPLRAVTLTLSLDHGLLRLDPLTLTLTQGRLGGAVSINARQDVPRVDLDMRLADARMESMFRAMETPPLTGPLYGRIRLSGSGAAMHDAAANADGDIMLVTPRGEIREALAELTGINVIRGLGLFLSDDQGTIPVRCGVAAFRVRNGIAQAHAIAFDTETILITGTGSISLHDESVNLRLEGQPKEARLVSIGAPITISGQLRSPSIGVDAGEALGQGGFAAVLGSLVAPIVGVLPFVDLGLAEDADCAALIAEARAA